MGFHIVIHPSAVADRIEEARSGDRDVGIEQKNLKVFFVLQQELNNGSM